MPRGAVPYHAVPRCRAVPVTCVVFGIKQIAAHVPSRARSAPVHCPPAPCRARVLCRARNVRSLQNFKNAAHVPCRARDVPVPCPPAPCRARVLCHTVPCPCRAESSRCRRVAARMPDRAVPTCRAVSVSVPRLQTTRKIVAVPCPRAVPCRRRAEPSEGKRIAARAPRRTAPACHAVPVPVPCVA